MKLPYNYKKAEEKANSLADKSISIDQFKDQIKNAYYEGFSDGRQSLIDESQKILEISDKEPNSNRESQSEYFNKGKLFP
jgi:hypothetical protein